MPTTTSSTTVALTINCPTDAANSTPIQMYISGAGLASGGNTWETCTSTKNITVTTGDGSKAITMKWRDSVGNESGVVNRSVGLSTSNQYYTLSYDVSSFSSIWYEFRCYQLLIEGNVTKCTWMIGRDKSNNKWQWFHGIGWQPGACNTFCQKIGKSHIQSQSCGSFELGYTSGNFPYESEVISAVGSWSRTCSYTSNINSVFINYGTDNSCSNSVCPSGQNWCACQ